VQKRVKVRKAVIGPWGFIGSAALRLYPPAMEVSIRSEPEA
jgi:hypothetical protein